MTIAPVVPHHTRTLRSLTLSLAVLLVLYAIDLTCTVAAPTSENAYVTNAAIPFDLVVVVPLIFYLTIVRRRKLSPILVLPVIWIGIIVSMQFVQTDVPSLHLLLLPAVAAVDIVILVCESRRFARTFRASQAAHTNPHDRFAEAFFVLTRNRQASHIAANEMTVWYYVIASWRRKPDEPPGSHAFTCYRNSGYLGLVGVLAVMTSIETLAVHLLISQWSEIAAIALTIISLYAVIFLVGNARAVVLNPLLIDKETVTVRWGMFFNERLMLNKIKCVQSQEPNLPKQHRINLGVMGMQPCWIILREPVSMRTFIGKKRFIQAINVSPDDRTAFIRLIQEGCADKSNT